MFTSRSSHYLHRNEKRTLLLEVVKESNIELMKMIISCFKRDSKLDMAAVEEALWIGIKDKNINVMLALVNEIPSAVYEKVLLESIDRQNRFALTILLDAMLAQEKMVGTRYVVLALATAITQNKLEALNWLILIFGYYLKVEQIIDFMSQVICSVNTKLQADINASTKNERAIFFILFKMGIRLPAFQPKDLPKLAIHHPHWANYIALAQLETKDHFYVKFTETVFQWILDNKSSRSNVRQKNEIEFNILPLLRAAKLILVKMEQRENIENSLLDLFASVKNVKMKLRSLNINYLNDALTFLQEAVFIQKEPSFDASMEKKIQQALKSPDFTKHLTSPKDLNFTKPCIGLLEALLVVSRDSLNDASFKFQYEEVMDCLTRYLLHNEVKKTYVAESLLAQWAHFDKRILDRFINPYALYQLLSGGCHTADIMHMSEDEFAYLCEETQKLLLTKKGKSEQFNSKEAILFTHMAYSPAFFGIGNNALDNASESVDAVSKIKRNHSF